MRNLLIVLIIVCLTISAGAGLILNGSFEAPVIANNSFTQFDEGETIDDAGEWLVISGEVDLVRQGTIHDGSQRLSLNGLNLGGKIGQEIATVENQIYKVTYWSLDRDYAFTVGVAETSDGNYTEFENVDVTSSSDWTYKEFEFTATGAATWVIFESNVSGDTGAGIDLVDVELVPEPATMLIFALGGLLLRRKK
ncbi:hypothetical protein SMSP2_02788 [Limihaloglobus sulfuriphilus]|uniref:PEP-CTERM protein-sorting domain-containing protein n=1 Tax=Limihaloglobus sulfuriphilus TaxID=1851148 RepID=A0A1Q2MIB6_9BACT|nr:DUF642 domain-containing protein [Limihaloglobus sulfuriphilus]AQQ72404.1 hypothetical protein SMSP2_02788 [Limihaloglobus sulfuriphilus]